MRKMNVLQLGLSFAGCFLGAGYVSGQELWQFFGSFGKAGIAGLLLAVLLLFLIGVIMLRLNQMTGIAEPDKLVIRRELPILRRAVTALELLFLFGVSTIMSAGVGALLAQLFSLPTWVGCLGFTALVALISLLGLHGMVSAFSVSVPILVVVTLLFGIGALSDGLSLPADTAGGNALLGSWPVAALSFACYNVFGSIAMIAPLGKFVEGKRRAVCGIALGAVLLLLIAGSVLACVFSAPAVTEAELPMLALASGKSEWLGYVYGLLLLLAMFGTALSSMVAFANMLCLKSKRIAERRKTLTAAYALGMFCGSLFGFGDLIGVIYPIFGYLSSAFIVLMAVHYIHIRKGHKNERTEAQPPML